MVGKLRENSHDQRWVMSWEARSWQEMKLNETLGPDR